MSSTMDKVSGKTKQIIGKATGDKKMQLKGRVQETVGKAKDSTKKAVNKL